MSVREIDQSLERWEMNTRDLHRRMILAPTPRERERWNAVWLLSQGWTASFTAEALGRDPRTIGRWAVCLPGGWPGGPDIRADRRFHPALGEATAGGAEWEAVQELPARRQASVLANWNWKAVLREFVSGRFGISLSRSTCLNYLHRHGIRLQASQETAAQGGR